VQQGCVEDMRDEVRSIAARGGEWRGAVVHMLGHRDIGATNIELSQCLSHLCAQIHDTRLLWARGVCGWMDWPVRFDTYVIVFLRALFGLVVLLHVGLAATAPHVA